MDDRSPLGSMATPLPTPRCTRRHEGEKRPKHPQKGYNRKRLVAKIGKPGATPLPSCGSPSRSEDTTSSGLSASRNNQADGFETDQRRCTGDQEMRRVGGDRMFVGAEYA